MEHALNWVGKQIFKYNNRSGSEGPRDILSSSFYGLYRSVHLLNAGHTHAALQVPPVSDSGRSRRGCSSVLLSQQNPLSLISLVY